MIDHVQVERLYKVASHYALQDYKRANPKNRKRFNRDGSPKAPNPYSLGWDAQEVHDLYKLALDIVERGECTVEEESRIKGYLLRHINEWM